MPRRTGPLASERRAPAGDVADEHPMQADLARCRRCELWEHATQAVAGEGPAGAHLMFVGEQPGDDEDVVGRPFVGPAGRLLRGLLVAAHIDAESVFLTNAVKHFRHELRGKRRIHKTPLQRHIAACHVWLDDELARVAPRVIVTLGATALAAVCGRRIAIADARTQALESAGGTPIVATYHPSAILRVPDHAERERLRRAVIADLTRAARRAEATR